MTTRKRKKKAEEPDKRKGLVPYAIRVRIVQAVMRGSTHADAAVAFGVSTGVIQKFMALFHSGGMEALVPRLHDGGAATKRKKKESARVPRDEVVAARAANPDWGTRRIRDVLARFEGLGVSETTVRRILHEEGLLTEKPEIEPREKPARRFERAEPNQLWQTDIFTFELRRHQRVYLVGFMDDFSRYLVSWAMAHHQKSSLVIEALERGIAEYGEPREVLTDQGRQYAAWRGTTEFQELLRRHGIAHSKSRPQHPETLGKIERFWKTLWEEFLRKTVFADFADCLRRIELFVQHYNFQRPHQGIESAVPADRFFRAAPHVRTAIEEQVKGNALRLAQEKPPHKPFYLVGRLGDQDLSIAAAGGALRVLVGEASQTIPITKESDDETQATRSFQNAEPIDEPQRAGATPRALAAPGAAQPRQGVSAQASSLTEVDDEAQTHDHDDEIGSPTSATITRRAALAEWSKGSGSGGAAEDALDPLGALWAYARDHGDLGTRNLAASVLPARDQRAGRDDASADSGDERRIESGRRDTDTPDQRARRQSREAGAGESATGAAALLREEGAAGGSDRDAGEAGAEAGPAIDERWAYTFALLEEASDDELEPGDFDPDDGWRDRAVTWSGKLAGADAPVEGEDDGESTRTEGTLDLPVATDGPAGAAPPLRGDPGGARWSADHQRCGDGAWGRAREHADARASSGSSDRGDPAATTDWAGAEAGAPEAAGEADQGERGTEVATPGGGRHDGGGRGDHPASPWTGPVLVEDVDDEVEAREQGGDRRGSGTNGGDRAAGTEPPGDEI